MMYKNWTCHVPLIYIRDRDSNDEWHLVGSDVHDVLEVIKDKSHLIYSNLQNCDSSEGGYEFYGEEWEIDCGVYEYHVKMVPWQEAVKIYKRLDKQYRRAYQMARSAAKKILKPKHRWYQPGKEGRRAYDGFALRQNKKDPKRDLHHRKGK